MIFVPDGAAEERSKYEAIWSFEQYQESGSPGLANVERFMSVLSPSPGSSVIDIGCGAGRAGLAFGDRGLKPWWLDLTPAALDPEVDRSRFIESPLWSPHWGERSAWDYGYCCDVLEHIPTEYAMLACHRIIENCDTSWLHICNLPDEFGKLIGEPLHLTVKPYQWWLTRLATLGEVIDARDLCGNSLFVVRR
jgi:hypothetical protein